MPLANQLKNAYLEWLNQKLNMKDLDSGIIEITSPLMDRHNDHLQIYVIPQEDGKLKLTDDAYILSDLMMMGFELNSSNKRKEIFNTIINGFGVKYSPKTDELYTIATLNDFPQKKHMLLQAMLAVNDMFMVLRSNIVSIFFEEVESFLYENDVRYTDNVSFIGKTGYSHKFHFLVPKSKKKPVDRIIQTLNNPTRDKTQNLIFAWSDTKETRKHSSQLFVFLNDTDRNIDTEVIHAFESYDISPILWSNRESILSELTA
ncbi:hypothetical protein NP92_02660 [Anoxybacillus gonensis]|uniref:DUF1829 domain-containing protein n=1 Tax=Anoxybacillus gonensis TaxID=198467 RepID=A0AAW7TFC4_9BACL|nr:DUF1829 domain-containing protein [Anoxybacillus gonensis]AKS37380.1 hypothetical protein AFK25_02235 [Anoxybacillus gonensis]KGP61318.1 hypothetical protein NP92_02660 [Anoxybacillus gonensis]MDO0876819.1 DUF1829 domain-containing protein [Anoxybacillus gonensis]